ncbi:MAG: diaminopimelate epimerase [Gammaproteobacteria bacterium]|nr:diaminopimelate epimerase [Gammaproteobacteria bacterium]
MRLAFTKMQGLGNDFVVLDARVIPLSLESSVYARLADRRYGVGCDQILFIEAPTRSHADIRYRVVNADGSSAEHCGNGVRCVAQYLNKRGAVRDQRLQVEVGEGVYEIILTPEGARVEMGVPRFVPAEIPLAVKVEAASYSVEFKGVLWHFGAVAIPNPHAVFEVADVSHAPVEALGTLLQAHPLFPQRVNVGFMQIVSRERLRLRVFERGVGETLACGTGACAAAAVGRLWGRINDSTRVELPGGELIIEWSGAADSTLIMSGPASEVFEGSIEI